jgi:hypothetical protein
MTLVIIIIILSTNCVLWICPYLSRLSCQQVLNVFVRIKS